MVDNKIINVSDKKIGQKKPIFIIAEAGVNHNGKLNLAKKLVDVAVNAGADAVKFQTFNSRKTREKRKVNSLCLKSLN